MILNCNKVFCDIVEKENRDREREREKIIYCTVLIEIVKNTRKYIVQGERPNFSRDPLIDLIALIKWIASIKEILFYG